MAGSIAHIACYATAKLILADVLPVQFDLAQCCLMLLLIKTLNSSMQADLFWEEFSCARNGKQQQAKSAKNHRTQ